MLCLRGGDSDIVIDICTKVDNDNKITYVWYDTGLEYEATKSHLKTLSKKYGVEIIPYKAQRPIPKVCKEYGQPFISKRVSEYIYRLQKHNFKFENEPYDVLVERYPKCKSALKWWCNCYDSSLLNIERNKWLKEFLIENPPTFKISALCCQYAKKNIAHKLIKDGKFQLNITGIRRSEGGQRSIVYKSCFDEKDHGCDNYRPLFWYTGDDKECYEKHFNVMHSDCYTKYGLKRTGCAGCPFGRDFEFELETIRQNEPKLFKAVNNIFGDSYKYTRKYKEFCKIKALEENKK